MRKETQQGEAMTRTDIIVCPKCKEIIKINEIAKMYEEKGEQEGINQERKRILKMVSNIIESIDDREFNKDKSKLYYQNLQVIGMFNELLQKIKSKARTNHNDKTRRIRQIN